VIQRSQQCECHSSCGRGFLKKLFYFLNIPYLNWLKKNSRNSFLSNLENIYLFIQGLDHLTYLKGVKFSSDIMNSVFNLYEECLSAHEGIRFKRGKVTENYSSID